MGEIYMFQINERDPKIKIADLIQAAKNGEDILIITEEQETIMLVQAEKPKKRRKAGSAKGKIEIADDFDAPLEEFKEYT
jgi:antitoxin (DNA-binding transcriptional repressor) of toxin-antitoxin stability system